MNDTDKSGTGGSHVIHNGSGNGHPAKLVVRWRAALGMAAALLLQLMFIIPFDRRPSWALLVYLSLGALTGAVWIAVSRSRAAWAYWRFVAAAPAMFLALTFTLYVAARWGSMLIPYAGRDWTIGFLWMGVGVVLGSLLGALDRAGTPPPDSPVNQKILGGATAAFRLALVYCAIALGLYAAAVGYPPAHRLPLPSFWHLFVLCVICIMAAYGRLPLAWRIPAILGALLTFYAIFTGPMLDRPARLSPEAALAWKSLLTSRIAFGAGPGATELFIAHRPSLGAAATAAASVWRYRIPAELGIAGLALLAAFLGAFAWDFPFRGAALRHREGRQMTSLSFFLLALGMFSGALGRPEMLALLGVVMGLAIALNEPVVSIPPYDGNLVSVVAMAMAVGALAVCVTVRNQIALRYNLRGQFYASQGNWLNTAEKDEKKRHDAVTLFTLAGKVQPDNPDHVIALALAYSHTPQSSLASPYLVTAADIDPFRPEVHVELARWMDSRGRDAEASVEITKALALDPGNKSYLSLQRRYARKAPPPLEPKALPTPIPTPKPTPGPAPTLTPSPTARGKKSGKK